MKQLWSPWRMEYIRSEKPEGCVLCSLHQDGQDPDNLVLFRGRHCYTVLNRYPYTNGHLMVVPYKHVDTPQDLDGDTLYEMMLVVNMCLEVLGEAMKPDGYNLGMNLGASAGAGIRDHVHMHVVPRWTGDTNFMPVLSDTRVIVEGLAQCYVTLRPLFDCRCEPFKGAAKAKGEPQERPANE